MDASALAELSACGVESARKLGREKSFQISDVLKQLEADYPDNDGAIDWADLGKDVSVFFRRIPTLDAMNGAFQSAKQKQKRRASKPREARKAREMAIEPTMTHSTQIEKDDEDKEGTTAQEIMDDVETAIGIKAPVGKKVDPLKFLVNPKSFSQTIENIFFTAFCAKKANIRIGVDKEGAPYMGEVKQDPSKSAEKDPQQFIFTLDYGTWKSLSSGKYPEIDPETSVIPHRRMNQ